MLMLITNLFFVFVCSWRLGAETIWLLGLFLSIYRRNLLVLIRRGQLFVLIRLLLRIPRNVLSILRIASTTCKSSISKIFCIFDVRNRHVIKLLYLGGCARMTRSHRRMLKILVMTTIQVSTPMGKVFCGRVGVLT